MALSKPAIALLGQLCGIAILIYMIIVGLIGTLLMLPFYIFIRPLSEPFYLKFVCMTQHSFLSMMPLFVEHCGGVELAVYGDTPKAEAALVLSNHLGHDWGPMYLLAGRIGTLGYIRTVIKQVVQYIPGLGQAMWLGYWPFVSRSYDTDKVRLTSLFGAIAKAGVPMQTWLFPEGTRRTPAKLKSSQEYAKTKNMPVWQHVMLPRYRGVMLSVDSMRGSVEYIHDLTIQYEGWGKDGRDIPSLWQIMSIDPSVRKVFHLHLKRVKMSDVSSGEEGARKWLHASFSDKEELLKLYEKTRTFGKPLPISKQKTPVVPLIIQMIPWVIGCGYFVAQLSALMI